MKRHLGVPVLAAILTNLAACSIEQSEAASLNTGAALVCRPGRVLVVSLRPDGRYALNRGVFDSARLVRELHNVLPPSIDKMVMVDVGRDRVTAPRWIISAIERDGGRAYAVDSVCLGPPPNASQWPFE